MFSPICKLNVAEAPLSRSQGTNSFIKGKNDNQYYIICNIKYE